MNAGSCNRLALVPMSPLLTVLTALTLTLSACTATPPGTEDGTSSATPTARPTEAKNCSFDSATRTLTLKGELHQLRVTPSGSIRTTPKSCRGVTVYNTDVIRLLPRGLTQLQLDGQPLAPGFTSEQDGASEIEAFVHADPRVNVSIRHHDNANWVLGTGGLNVNMDDDADVVVRGQVRWALDLSAGEDTVTTLGGHGTGSPFLGYVAIYGRGGNDVLVYGRTRGGDAPSAFAGGGDGDDRIIGGAQGLGRQWLLGEGGRDVLLGGPGPDELEGGLGSDTLNGGPGKDRCITFGRDRLRSCENISEYRPPEDPS
jgi:RTX calcium-binding nonapeptide repeat (4 copies)